MDRAMFERERTAIQELLAEQGQELVIPDPESPEYLNVFLALQRTHPALARRLAEAEQADPAELFDPYIPREPKITLRHRINTFLDKSFNRPGIDGKRVLDRQKAYRAALYTAGGIVIGGMVYSVVAPKPVQKADKYATETTSAENGVKTSPGSNTTNGAFLDGDSASASNGVKQSPTAATGKVAPPKDEDVFATTVPDSKPRPVSASGSASSSSNNTPPPPAVFNQVSPDPYTPAATTSTPIESPAAASQPPSYADSGSSSGSDSTSPFGSSAEPEPQAISTSSTPTPVASADIDSPPFNPPSDSAPAPVTAVSTSDQGKSLPPVSAPFGGETASAPAPTASATPPAVESEKTPVQDEETTLTRGAALIYQRQNNTQAQASNSPKTAMIYQAQRESEQSQNVANTTTGGKTNALVYQQVMATTNSGSTRNSLIYQTPKRATPSETAPASATQNTAVNDPDAPQFAPTSVIAGKLFSNIRTAAGMAVPAIVVSKDGNWIGTATYNTSLGRVDIRFDSFVQYKNNKSYPVQATAFQVVKGHMAEGVGANIHPIAPTLAVDLARAGLNSLNTYSQALQNASTVSSNGSMITSTQTAPALVQVVRGELGKVFALPDGNQSINIVADVEGGTDIQIVYGIVSTPKENSLVGIADGVSGE